MKIKEKRGITLIALIITIVVMLILVGVSISIMINSNLFSQTQVATNSTKNALEREKNYQGNIIIDGKEYTIDEYAKILEGEEISREKIKANPTGYYGKTVEGLTLNNGDTGTKWQIFYADDKNIYLIAEDLVNITATPKIANVLTQSSTTGDNKDYYYKFTKTISTSPYSAGATSITEIGKTLLNTYLAEYPNSTNSNIRAVSMMLDTNLWGEYYTDSNQETSYIEYAIGGPTIEILAASYKDVTGELLYTPIWSSGYFIGNTEETTGSSYNIATKTQEKGLKGLYVKERHYWLASPSGYNDSTVCNVLSDGLVDYSTSTGPTIGLRPLVCLKSNVKLTSEGVSEGFDFKVSI